MIFVFRLIVCGFQSFFCELFSYTDRLLVCCFGVPVLLYKLSIIHDRMNGNESVIREFIGTPGHIMGSIWRQG